MEANKILASSVVGLIRVAVSKTSANSVVAVARVVSKTTGKILDKVDLVVKTAAAAPEVDKILGRVASVVETIPWLSLVVVAAAMDNNNKIHLGSSINKMDAPEATNWVSLVAGAPTS